MYVLGIKHGEDYGNDVEFSHTTMVINPNGSWFVNGILAASSLNQIVMRYDIIFTQPRLYLMRVDGSQI